jgi:predicted HicB family RNase H-like nuclease
MKKRDYDRLSSLRVRPEIHRAVKVQAAREGVSLIDLADDMIQRALKDRDTTRLKGRKVTRVPSPD